MPNYRDVKWLVRLLELHWGQMQKMMIKCCVCLPHPANVWPFRTGGARPLANQLLIGVAHALAEPDDSVLKTFID